MSTWPGTCFLGEFGNGIAFIRQAFNATIPTPLPGSPVFVVYAGDSVVIPPGNVGGWILSLRFLFQLAFLVGFRTFQDATYPVHQLFPKI